jgi:hypothetical protein
VTTGPFRWSRNPLYLANLIIYVGTTLVVDALWPFVLLVPLIALLEWGVIRREERYLSRKFGAPYDAYRARVRRWLEPRPGPQLEREQRAGTRTVACQSAERSVRSGVSSLGRLTPYGIFVPSSCSTSTESAPFE